MYVLHTSQIWNKTVFMGTMYAWGQLWISHGNNVCMGTMYPYIVSMETVLVQISDVWSTYMYVCPHVTLTWNAT